MQAKGNLMVSTQLLLALLAMLPCEKLPSPVFLLLS